jgi:hypothetical protein
MQGTTDKASIPIENERNGGRMSGVRRKFTNLLDYFNPFSTIRPPQDEDVPVSKKRRLEASTGVSTAEDADIFLDAQTYRYMADDTLTASLDDTAAAAPTDTVTVAAKFLPSSQAPHARARAFSTPRKWTQEEDAKLTDAVKKHGADNWNAIAALVPARNYKQCAQRWAESLDPDINQGKWTPEEDEKLTEAVTKHGSNWVPVAALVPGRTNTQCRHRWSKHKN